MALSIGIDPQPHNKLECAYLPQVRHILQIAPLGHLIALPVKDIVQETMKRED